MKMLSISASFLLFVFFCSLSYKQWQGKWKAAETLLTQQQSSVFQDKILKPVVTVKRWHFNDDLWYPAPSGAISGFFFVRK